MHGELRAATWLEPLDAGAEGEVLARGAVGPLLVRRRRGAGEVVAVGTHAGLAYRRERHDGFELLLRALARRADATAPLACSVGDGERVQWRIGDAGAGERLLFATNEGPACSGALGAAAGGPVRDLLGGAAAELAVEDGAQVLRTRLADGGSHVFLLPR